MLSKEPPWCDGSNCYECAAKFGVTTRKHHWYVLGLHLSLRNTGNKSDSVNRFFSSHLTSRHCGRLLCHKCSVKEIPIIKFDLNKPVRVCDICFDVLTLGGVS